MKESLKKKIRRLISAINEALSESGDVSDSMEGVRDEGFDLFLILEATVVLNRKGEILALEEDDWEDDEMLEGEEEAFDEDEALECELPTGLSTEVSQADQEFLRSLRIRYQD